MIYVARAKSLEGVIMFSTRRSFEAVPCALQIATLPEPVPPQRRNLTKRRRGACD